MRKLFISYRRDDSAGVAGRIYDRLQSHFGSDSVFMDVDSIPYGVDFRQHVAGVLGNCDVLLAVIGGQWLTIEQDGKRRLENPNDLVRIEIETALAREIPVIPVLIGRTPMPQEEELPHALRALTRRNAAQVDSGLDFHAHVDRLIREVEEPGRRPKGPPPAPPQVSPPAAMSATLVLVCVAAVAVGPVVPATFLGLFSPWAEVPILSRYAVASVPIGGVVWVLNTWRARQVKALGRARQQDGIHELARRLIGRLHQPELLTVRSVRGLAFAVEQRLGCPLMTDKIISEAIRAAALELEDRLSGPPLLAALETFNQLLLAIDADAIPLLSLASIDRLNAYLPTQLYLMAPLFCGLAVVALGPSLFGMRIPTVVYSLCALLLLAQLGLLLSNARLASFWRRDPNAPLPPGRAVAGLDVFRIMMTARKRALDWVMDCLWGPIWEAAMLMTTRPGRFSVMHEFRYEVAQALWRRLRDVQDELDDMRPQSGAEYQRRIAEFASLCRQLWVVTGEKRFREIEARGQITSEDLDNRIIYYL